MFPLKRKRLTGDSNCTLPLPKGRLQRKTEPDFSHRCTAPRGKCPKATTTNCKKGNFNWIAGGIQIVRISAFATFPLQIALLVRWGR